MEADRLSSGFIFCMDSFSRDSKELMLLNRSNHNEPFRWPSLCLLHLSRVIIKILLFSFSSAQGNYCPSVTSSEWILVRIIQKVSISIGVSNYNESDGPRIISNVLVSQSRLPQSYIKYIALIRSADRILLHTSPYSVSKNTMIRLHCNPINAK